MTRFSKIAGFFQKVTPFSKNVEGINAKSIELELKLVHTNTTIRDATRVEAGILDTEKVKTTILTLKSRS